MKVAPKTHLFQVDLIRLIAIIGVVLIHLVYPVYGRPDFLGGPSWWLATLLNTFSRTSVPMFIMLSGYLVLPKQETLSQTWQRTYHRLLVPLVFWFCFYLGWNWYYLSKFETRLDALQMMVLSNMYHLYFLVILAGLYLLLPVWRSLIATAPRLTVWYVAGLSFTAGILVTLAQYLLFPSFTLVNAFTIWFLYLGYFLFGYLLPQISFSLMKGVVLFLAAFVLTLQLAYLNLWFRGEDITWFWRSSGVAYFDEYLSPNVIIMSISLFLLLLKAPGLALLAKKYPLLRKSVTTLSGAAFAVYLVHFVIINILDFRFRYAIEFLETGLMEYLVTRVFWGLTLSFGAGLILVRIPFFNRIVGEQ